MFSVIFESTVIFFIEVTFHFLPVVFSSSSITDNSLKSIKKIIVNQTILLAVFHFVSFFLPLPLLTIHFSLI